MRRLLLAMAFTCLTTGVNATCGGNFGQFVAMLKQEALSLKYKNPLVNSFFDVAKQDPKVLKADRSQGVFQKDFITFYYISETCVTYFYV